jgi:hypothetical protein
VFNSRGEVVVVKSSILFKFVNSAITLPTESVSNNLVKIKFIILSNIKERKVDILRVVKLGRVVEVFY